MAKDSSFDIISDFDPAKMNNAVEQAQREISNRYDFKGTPASLLFDDDKNGLVITGSHDFHIDSITDIIRKKLAGVGISQKVLDTSSEPTTSNLIMKQKITFKKGLDAEKAKKITQFLRNEFPKVKAMIQGETVRVTSPKRDELQAVISSLKDQEFDFPIDFNNYR